MRLYASTQAVLLNLPNSAVKLAVLHVPVQDQARILNHTDISSGFISVLRPDPVGSRHHVTVKLPIGSVRASLGYLSTFEDVYALVDFLSTYRQQSIDAAALAATSALS